MICERKQHNMRVEAPVSLELYNVPSAGRRRNRKGSNKIVKALEKTLFTLAAMSVLGVASYSVVQFVQSHFSSPKVPIVTRLTVAPGDTLWKIAATVGGAGAEQTDVVSQIRQLNPQLNGGSNLSVGETLLVPVKMVNGQDDQHLAEAIADR